MSKYIHLIFLIFACIVCLDANASAKNTYRIGILLDEQVDSDLIENLRSHIKSVVGEDANIVFPNKAMLINQYNLHMAQAQYKQLVRQNIDIIIAFGVVNNQAIMQRKTYPKPTILFGAVNRDVNPLPFDKKVSGIKNFTYLVDSESYKIDLKQLKSLTNFDSVGIIVRSQTLELLPLNTVFSDLAKQLGVQYKIITMGSLDEIEKQLQGIDAVYMADGFVWSESEVKALAQLLIEKKLPSFTINGAQHVEWGMMASYSSRDEIEQFIRRIALAIEAYISGVPLSDMPVLINNSRQISINFNTAYAISVPLRYSQIAQVDFVGDFTQTKGKTQYNLKRAITQALQKNRNLHTSQLDVRLSKKDIAAAKNRFLPKFSTSIAGNHIDSRTARASAGTNPEYVWSAGASVNQLLFSEDAYANIHIQKQQYKAQQAQYRREQLDTVLNIANLYLATLAIKANLQTQLQNLQLTRENLNLARQSYEAGQSKKFDVLRFESQKAQNVQSLIEQANRLEQLFFQFNQSLSNSVNENIDIDDVSLGHDVFQNYDYHLLSKILDDPRLQTSFVDLLTDTAKRNSPELETLEYNIKAIERQIRRNGVRRFLPNIALQGQYNEVIGRDGVGSPAPNQAILDSNYNIMLNFSIDIFNQNRFNVDKQRALLTKKKLMIQREELIASLERNVRSKVLDLINQISHIELSKVSEKSAKEALRLTRLSYKNGAANVTQLLDAQNNYLQVKLINSNAVYDFLRASFALERAIGYFFILHSKKQNDALKQQFQTQLKQKISS